MPIPGIIPQGPVTAKDLRSPGLGRYLGLLICLLPEPAYLASPSNLSALGAGGSTAQLFYLAAIWSGEKTTGCTLVVRINHSNPLDWWVLHEGKNMMHIKSWLGPQEAEKGGESQPWKYVSQIVAANKKLIFTGKEGLSRSILEIIWTGSASPVLKSLEVCLGQTWVLRATLLNRLCQEARAFLSPGLGCAKIPACLNSEPGQSAFGLLFIHETFFWEQNFRGRGESTPNSGRNKKENVGYEAK